MRKSLLLTLALLPALIFSGCRSERKGDAKEALPYSPYVEAFTSGKVSRTTPIYLILNQDIDSAKLTSDALQKSMKIKPEASGAFEFENNRTVVFKPADEFKRNTNYSVTADLGQLLGAEGKEKSFSFRFSTLPLTLRGAFEALNVSEQDEGAYDMICNFFTPDSEAPETIESIIVFSEKVDAVWAHDANGKKHQVTLRGVKPGASSVRTINISVGANKFGAPKENVLSVYVPAGNEFGVYDVSHVFEPERYVEVTFTRTLDPKQSLHGLAYIAGNRNETVTPAGNKLRLYPDTGSKGTLTVRLDRSIRAKDGTILGQDVETEIEISSEAPAIRFIGKGVVVPQSSQVLVPFQAVYLRGVTVHVIRILEQNVGQFLQANQMDGSSELVRVGRLVARKTIFLDEYDQDLSQWGTYAIDLKEVAELEPGAIYRVELSFDKDLSSYPCDDMQRKSKEQILAEDDLKFRTELETYDGSTYYSDYADWYWYDYDYYDRDDPCTNSFYYDTAIGRNVLATNLGVMAKSGESGEITVLVHNILTTQPEAGVAVTVHNYQHQVLGSGTTDAKGQATVQLAANGKPYYVTVSQGKQRSYLRVDQGSSLSLSAFDVAGEVVQKGIKGFIYGERGVWRPGDPIYLSFMLSDRAKTLPADHPVVMELYNPLGQLYQRKTLTRGVMGVYAFEMNTDSEAPTGGWEVKVVVGGITFNKRIRVETIKPNRLKIDLKFDDKVLEKGRPVRGKLHTEWLTGATASGLNYEMEATFATTATSFDKFREFTFDDPSKQFESGTGGAISGKTDEKGDATFSGNFSPGNNAPGMLTATFNTRVYEESGDFSIDAVRVPYSPYSRYAGVKSPQKSKRQLHTGSAHTFEVASVEYDGKPAGGAILDVQIWRVNWSWWWSGDKEGLANYVASSYNTPVKNLTVTTKSNGTGSFDLNFSDDEWGTYYIQVRDRASGHSTGVMTYFDWPWWGGRRDPEGGDAAARLNFSTDKEVYAPGEKINITIPSSEGSRAVVSVENGTRVLSIAEYECKGKETQLKIDVTPDMQPNAYIHITLLQPHGITVNDLPIRLYGVVPVTVTSPESRLHPVIKAPEEIQPENKYEIVVSEQNGREMAYTLAIVDEGLLDLTRFRTPDPWNTFNAREALGVRSWDMYNYVVGAFGGRIEQLFSIGGGDDADAGPKAQVNRFKPVVQFEGPFLLKKGAKQKHTYSMPNYLGRVRVMVVAGDGAAYGNAEQSVLVRKPVMLLGTLPRVIGTNEEMVIPATVFALTPNLGNVEVSIACSDNMEVVGGKSQTLSFSDVSDKQATFRIRVKGQPGAGKVTLTAKSKNDQSVYETELEIRSVRRPQTRVTAIVLEGGKTWSETVAMPGADGTNKLALEVSSVEPVNLSARLSFLLGYPHGCIEQITSKGFPQLYLKQFSAMTKQQETLAEESVKEVINRQRTYQTPEGGFSYWPGGSAPNAWGSIYATHFQLEAEAKGFLVPEGMKKAGINYLKLVAAGWKGAENSYQRSESTTQAYRLYVLALATTPEMGAMNRLRETENLPPAAKWLLASAYALVGRTDVANEITGATTEMGTYVYDQYDYTFGSDLRDKAIRLIALNLTGREAEAAVTTSEISKVLASDSWLSTQTTGMALVALSQYMNKFKTDDTMEFAYDGGGKKDGVKTTKSFWSANLVTGGGVSAPVKVENKGKGTLFVRVITEGIPEQGTEEAYANGLALETRYADAAGNTIGVTDLSSGANFSAIVTVRNPTSTSYNNIVLSQIFPAGWEILNTRFTTEGATDSYPAGVSYQDIRDDRVYTYMDVLPAGRQVTVHINLAAVYRGSFYSPPVWVEAMYDNKLRANTEGTMVTVK